MHLLLCFQNTRYWDYQRQINSNSYFAHWNVILESTGYLRSELWIRHNILSFRYTGMYDKSQFMGLYTKRGQVKNNKFKSCRSEFLYWKWWVGFGVNIWRWHYAHTTIRNHLFICEFLYKASTSTIVSYYKHTVSSSIDGSVNCNGVQTSGWFWGEDRILLNCSPSLCCIFNHDFGEYSQHLSSCLLSV